MIKNISLVAHRGQWEQKSEMNTLISFKNAFRNSFGIETDLKGYKGKAYISHDLITNINNCNKLIVLINLYKKYGEDKVLEINIKSDELINLAIDLFKINTKIIIFFSICQYLI